LYVQVSLLSRIHHRNLVAFLGYCHEDGRNILVYEFMMNGTLKEHLHGNFLLVPSIISDRDNCVFNIHDHIYICRARKAH
jgi:serine/threonine protein kinase